MLPFFTEHFGNASSRNHPFGWKAGKAVEQAREQVGALIGARFRDVVFTSGATESNNLAIKGLAARAASSRRHVVTIATEHRAVLDPCRTLERDRFRVTYLGVDREGRIDLDRLRDAVTDDTLLVSAMSANNEIGVLHPLARDRGDRAREGGALSLRCRAVCRPCPPRREAAWRRSRLAERAQDVWTEGDRRLVRRETRSRDCGRRAHRWRRARARVSIGHAQRARDRGVR